MTVGWSVDIGAAGAALTTYESAVPLFFLKRLNGVGHFTLYVAQLDGHAALAREQVVRITWNKGESDERTHLEGFITDVREDARRGAYWVRGLTLEGLLAQSTLGSIRTYSSVTPYVILTSGGSPRGLIYNSQNNLKPVGGTTLQYGTSASVPNKVDAVNPGTAMSFLADSSRNATNIQRLCLQARYDGASYGLEWFCRLEGANLSNPRVYVVKRRTRAAVYTPEVWTVDDQLLMARRGTEGLTAAQLVRVIGMGDGTSRIDSGAVGAGGLEGIVADKSILNATNATNMANRLSELLDPTTEIVTAYLATYAHTSELGDDVTVRHDGRADATLRLYEVSYDYRKKLFTVVLGRPRSLPDDPLSALDKLSGSQAQAPQVTDFFPSVLEGDNDYVTVSYAGGTLSVGDTDTVSETTVPDDFGLSDGFWLRVDIAANAGATLAQADDHTHTVDTDPAVDSGGDTYDRADTPTGGASDRDVVIQGPFALRIYLDFGGGVVTNLAHLVVSRFPTDGSFLNLSAGYPFAARDGTNYTPVAVRMDMVNLGPYPVSISNGTQVTVFKKPLRRLNVV